MSEGSFDQMVICLIPDQDLCLANGVGASGNLEYKIQGWSTVLIEYYNLDPV